MKTYIKDKRTNAHFKDCREYQRYLRRTGDILDHMQIGNIVYTMDEYDHDGKYMTYGNKRTGYSIQVNTANRYSDTGTRDAIVYKWNSGCWRNDIDYID